MTNSLNHQGTSHKGQDDDGSKLVVAFPLEAADGHHGYSSPRGDGADNLVAVHMLQDPISDEKVTPAWGKGTKSGSASIAVNQGAGVRRLTPRECEALQALPLDWTAHGPDSRRYAALGDAVTASVSEWIGRRLVAA